MRTPIRSLLTAALLSMALAPSADAYPGQDQELSSAATIISPISGNRVELIEVAQQPDYRDHRRHRDDRYRHGYRSHHWGWYYYNYRGRYYPHHDRWYGHHRGDWSHDRDWRNRQGRR